MRTIDLIKMGLRNLGRRKARTALTVVGVVIGTISIVVMFSIGIGMNTNFRKQVMELGSLTNITIEKYQDIYDSNGEWSDWKEQKIDEKLLKQVEQIEHVEAASPVYEGNVRLKSGKYEAYMTVYAMDSSCFQIFGFPELTYGKWPTQEDTSPILFGSAVMTENFYNPKSTRYDMGNVAPTDRITMEIQNWEVEIPKKQKKYKVNPAVMKETGNWEYDYMIYMDVNEYLRIYKSYMKGLSGKDYKKAKESIEQYGKIKINVDNVKNVESVQEAIKTLGYNSSSLSVFTKPMEKTSKMLQMVLGGVGAVAMLVSAISIANTMVMSIYERTKEIGVMKVLGCIVSDIKKLFLFEAAMIGFIGGAIGIVLSYIASFAINKFGEPIFAALMSTSIGMGENVSTKFSIIPFWLPILAALFAMTVGVISGYYPAKRATKISAMEAMKNEQ